MYIFEIINLSGSMAEAVQETLFIGYDACTEDLTFVCHGLINLLSYTQIVVKSHKNVDTYERGGGKL